MTRFYELPDYMDYGELRQCFIEYLVIYANNTNKDNIYYALDELLELADRQWHTYEFIDKDVKEQLEKYLISIIEFDDEEIMDSMLCIIPRIGLENVFNYILKFKSSIINKKIKSRIEDSINEYGETVDNPYSGMENI